MSQHDGEPVALPPNLLAVPRVKQRTNYSCGNAATLALLRYWRWDTYARLDESALYAPLQTTPARGTEPEPIAAFFRSIEGMDAQYRHGDLTVADLERAVSAGQPPIVDLQAWSDHDAPYRDVWDAGHYVVMVGYDAKRFFFMDPGTLTPGSYAYLLRRELDERWHDLTGAEGTHLERMTIFVQGSEPPRRPDELRGEATRDAMPDALPNATDQRATKLG
ncbi:MAG: C39 family peptidase [Myxococcota bacterium]|nr:C39 family peptidase [Myxococcota bacterium]